VQLGFAQLGFAQVGFAQLGFAQLGFAQLNILHGRNSLIFFYNYRAPIFVESLKK
jgi:hypothetical protein